MGNRILFLMLFASFNSVILSKVLFYNFNDVNSSCTEHKILIDRLEKKTEFLNKRYQENSTIGIYKTFNKKHELINNLATLLYNRNQEFIKRIIQNTGHSMKASIHYYSNFAYIHPKDNITNLIVEKIKTNQKKEFSFLRQQVNRVCRIISQVK